MIDEETELTGVFDNGVLVDVEKYDFDSPNDELDYGLEKKGDKLMLCFNIENKSGFDWVR